MKKNKYAQESNILRIVPSDESNLWDADWIIYLKSSINNTRIGTANFAGTKEYGTVPITVNIDEQYQNRGYGTDAFKLMSRWALLFRNTYEVQAVTRHDNHKCIIALEKAGFVYRSSEGRLENKTETYSILKKPSTWLGLYLFLGLIAGLIIGIVIESSWIGLAIGLIVGGLIGYNMDLKLKKNKEAITGKKGEN